jgi:small subunit ribosomal protein S15
MALTKEKKIEIRTNFGVHAEDTGSSSVQIVLLTEKINYLSEHLKLHKKDYPSRRGLLIFVAKRRKLLDYLKRYQPKEYSNIASKLKLRK